MKKKKKIFGFTLVELILMIIIAGIAIPPLTNLLIYMNKETQSVMPFVRPNTLAVEIMEEIKSKKWDENWIGGPLDNVDKTSSSNLGPETGETSRALYDDIDDYNSIQNAIPTDVLGNPLTQYEGYTVTVNVYYVPGLTTSTPDFSTNDTSIPPISNSKRVDIIINKGDNKYQTSTIVCNY